MFFARRAALFVAGFCIPAERGTGIAFELRIFLVASGYGHSTAFHNILDASSLMPFRAALSHAVSLATPSSLLMAHVARCRRASGLRVVGYRAGRADDSNRDRWHLRRWQISRARVRVVWRTSSNRQASRSQQRRWLWEFPFWLGINDGFGNLQHRYVEQAAQPRGFIWPALTWGPRVCESGRPGCQEFHALSAFTGSTDGRAS